MRERRSPSTEMQRGVGGNAHLFWRGLGGGAGGPWGEPGPEAQGVQVQVEGDPCGQLTRDGEVLRGIDRRACGLGERPRGVGDKRSLNWEPLKTHVQR